MDQLITVADRIGDRGRELADDDFELLDVRWLNGLPQVHIAGYPNHRGSAEPLLEFFRWIGTVAPGSYGLLYYWDDEDPRGVQHRNQYRVLVMTRGTVTEQDDPFLSPCEPTIDDPLD